MPLGARGDAGARNSGMKFRKIINEDGSLERWKKPRLADWEVPRRDPSAPRPRHPEVLAQRRRVQRRWRARRRAAREAASLAEREGAELPATHDAYRAVTRWRSRADGRSFGMAINHNGAYGERRSQPLRHPRAGSTTPWRRHRTRRRHVTGRCHSAPATGSLPGAGSNLARIYQRKFYGLSECPESTRLMKDLQRKGANAAPCSL